uniref:Protein-tyrosine sulfotransferase n=1 Tax=Ananas comosus var. bracteatus TaxID=296719 RepID=A0A6V7NQT4_ANACO|nr:unnamed protein product [Ananas comosus var. bracteatus]
MYESGGALSLGGGEGKGKRKKKGSPRLPMRLLMSYGGVGAVLVRRIRAAAYEHEMASPSIPRPPPRPSLLLLIRRPAGVRVWVCGEGCGASRPSNLWYRVSFLVISIQCFDLSLSLLARASPARCGVFVDSFWRSTPVLLSAIPCPSILFFLFVFFLLSPAGKAQSRNREMAGNLSLPVIVVYYWLAVSTPVSSNEDNYFRCERVVKNWVESSCENGQGEDKSSLKDLLFFLHVPRTGGRTYFHCFLRKLYTSAQECPRSYDKLRFDPSKPNCRLVVSHDDYSLTSKLPKDRTSVVTIFRKPVDRVFSTYEFSVEVAARFLVHPNLTSAKQMSRRIRPKSRGVSTLDIWPWKYLVPWMREDLFARRDARKLGKLRRINEITDPYNMEEMVMPLHDFINDPVAHEIVHNGATFQLTFLEEAKSLIYFNFDPIYLGRRTDKQFLFFRSARSASMCEKTSTLGRAVLEVAKSRLDRMLYVGLTEDHKKSARLFVNMVGAQVLSQSKALSSSDVETQASARTELSSSFPESKTEGPDQVQSSNYSQLGTEVPSSMDTTPAEANMTVEKLMGAYEECISTLRKSQSTRRNMSLKQVAPANFSKEARLLVPEAILQQIISLNSLDVELYRHAESIFLQQKHHIHKAQGAFIENCGQMIIENEHKSTWSDLCYGCFSWKVFLLTTIAICLILFAISKKRRTSKLKV